MLPEVETALRTLGETFQENPFDFIREADVVSFLLNELRGHFSDRIHFSLDSKIDKLGIFEEKELVSCRVHANLRIYDTRKLVDIVVLENEKNTVYAKSKGVIGGFEENILAGIEIKVAHGRHSYVFSKRGVLKDLEKLSSLKSQIKHRYVVVLDYWGDRDFGQVKELLADSQEVSKVYINTNRTEIF